MRLRNLSIPLSCACILGAVVLLALAVKPDDPLDARIVSTANMGNAKVVTVEFWRQHPKARFAEDPQVQTRIAGHWKPPQDFPPLDHNYLLARTNCQQVVFTFPAQTEACRFVLGYRVGARPYCRTYFFLQRHGLYKKYPKLSRMMLKRVPQEARLRHVEYELVIPAKTDDGIVAAVPLGAGPQPGAAHGRNSPFLREISKN
jgi:hypothetical protein